MRFRKHRFNANITTPYYYRFLDRKIIVKSVLILLLTIISLTNTFSWMYHEYKSGGATVKLGSIKHEIIEYDINGNLINNNDETLSLIYENNMSNKTRNSRFIEVKNTGSLDLEYSLTFSVNGSEGASGALYYRLYEITDEVLKMSTDSHNDTKLKAYAAKNPISDDIESNTAKPISNLTTLNNKLVIGEIKKDEKNEEKNSVYYRLDYGMYNSIDSSIYSNSVVSAHMNVYSSQVGTILSELALGKVWNVENEEQFRGAMQGAYPGDTIRLTNDIIIDGSIEFNKRVSLDTNEQLFKVTGDLLFEFVSLGKMKIDVTGSGRIEVGNDLYINAPKAQVEIIGANKASDIVVTGKVTMNGIQDKEKNGILLDNVKMVKSTTTYIPVDIILLSNTRLTIAPNVVVGFVKANPGSTNIEIVNNGTISQIQLQNMSLLDTFTKPQIYIYNLGNILGTVGSTSIVVPAKATPYKGPNDGNTLIVKGVTSSDITISGSDSFKDNNIDDETEGTSVIPFKDEENAYYVYIREPNENVKNLLEEYFTQKNENPAKKISEIKKLSIYTLNAQYVENDDFDFFKGNETLNLNYLDLANARVKDDSVVNRIKSHALENKNTLDTVILPKTLTEIGACSFKGVELGKLSPDITVPFTFLSIPSSVDKIESNAFIDSKYIKFEGTYPPTNIAGDAFNTSDDGAKIFVLDGVEDLYQSISSLNPTNIFRNANISDNRKYFVYEVGEDLGISYIINSSLSTTSLGIPDTLSYLSTNKKIVEIGTNAYRHINISKETGVTTSMPTTITKIGSYAFYGLNITNIDLNNVKFIGKYAFYNTSLERIIAPSVEEIEDYAFYANKAKVIYLDSVKKIGDYAFANSSNLYEINLAKVSHLGDYALYDCKQLSRVYFENIDASMVNNKEELNLYVGKEAAFVNWGYYINNRLRVYVPSGTSAGGKTYLDLYKEKFKDYERYIYENGESVGSYHHLAVPQDLTEYTVKEKTITTLSGEVVVGLEIISYQGADLKSDYKIPNELTINGKTSMVISIGDNAYRNTKVADGNTLKLFNDNIVKIGNNAFMDLNISSITATKVEEIGNFAFSGSTLNKGIFRSLLKLGDYALANIDELYVLDLGVVKNFGYNSIANDRHLQQLFISNKTMDIVLNGTPFSNIGTFTKDRFRIYVPDVDVVIKYYKELIPEYNTYIYPTGRIEGSFVNTPIDYDIGEYSLREKVITDKSGNVNTGYELIEYHGADLNANYNIPEVISPVTKNVKVTFEKGSCWEAGGMNCNYKISIANNSDNDIDSWEIDIPLPQGVKVSNVYEGDYVKKEGFVTIRNKSYNGHIGINQTLSSVSLLMNYRDPYYVPTATNVRINMGNNPGLKIISVGDYAFYHTNSMPGHTFDVNNNTILEIGKGAFENVRGLNSFTSTSVETINEDAFKSSELKKGTFTNVNHVKTNAFNNMPYLYYLDLGKVKTLDSKAISDCNYLYQLNFTGTDLKFKFSSDAINNIGSLTNNRLRIYVKDGNQTISTTYAEAYSNVFDKQYKDRFYQKGVLIGNFVPTDINNNIFEYNVKKVTVKNKENTNVTGWEIIDYHGKDIVGDFVLPNTLTYNKQTLPIVSIGNKAFISNNIKSGNKITFGNVILNIGDYAFYKTNIEHLVAPNTLYFGKYSFSECDNLKVIDLKSSYNIKPYAFYNNPSLTSATLGPNLVEMGEYALYNTLIRNNLNKIYISTPTPPKISSNSLPEFAENVDDNKTIIYVPYSSVNSYKQAEYWKNYPIKNMGNIYNQTFVYEIINNEELRITDYLKDEANVVIPDTLNIDGKTYKVVELANSLFYSNTTVKNITLPLHLKNIGDDFLVKNVSVTNINISSQNNGFSTLNGVLYNKDRTTLIKYPNGRLAATFTVPRGVILIKKNAFTNAINLANVNLNSDLFIISSDSFKGCINLTNVKFTSQIPPYITSFDVIPLNKNLKIMVPKGKLNEYLKNPYYYKYKNYMVEE